MMIEFVVELPKACRKSHLLFHQKKLYTGWEKLDTITNKKRGRLKSNF